MVFKLKVGVILFLWVWTSYANSTCTEVRLDGHDGPFSKIPVYDQEKFESKDPGICYSIAASHLIDADRYYKVDSELKQTTSPFSIALNYKEYDEQDKFTDKGTIDILSFGDTYKAIVKNQTKTVCDQRFLENFISYSSDGKNSNQVLYSNKKKSQENFIKETIA
jgi:hypothetical protein